jgi:hypothetical protein
VGISKYYPGHQCKVKVHMLLGTEKEEIDEKEKKKGEKKHSFDLES